MRVSSVSQYGITWTFDKPCESGQFVNGDYWVAGSVKVIAIQPKPLYGADVPENERDRLEKMQKVEQLVHNGFMLNPPARMEVAYDSGVQSYFRPSLIQKLPVVMKPGDSLVSTISMLKGVKCNSQLVTAYDRGNGSPVRVAAILTCVDKRPPSDAFRPAFCDREARIYLARNLKRNLLPKAAIGSLNIKPDLKSYIGFTQKPWVGTCFFGFESPAENMPQYGREYGRVVGLCGLTLCTDLTPEQKEPLLINFVQVGIDLAGMLRAGHPGWEAWGGHGNGRKFPIVFAGLLLGDDEMANINRSYPKAHFGEDEQTAYGDSWTGAKVVFTGHSGIDTITGIGRNCLREYKGEMALVGPYEHLSPDKWGAGGRMSEDYRRCCTSSAWVGQALALHLLKAEKAWNHDAFFDYVDRWMFEEDASFSTEAAKYYKDPKNHYEDPAPFLNSEAHWFHQRFTWDPFIDAMWMQFRTAPGMPPVDGWKKPHDDSYYRNAVEKQRKTP